MKFETLTLAPALLEAVAQKGYHTATPIQRDAIPPILEGRDLVGCAQTGTGKTAAFALPTLHRMLESIERSKIAGPLSDPAPSPRRRRLGRGENSAPAVHVETARASAAFTPPLPSAPTTALRSVATGDRARLLPPHQGERDRRRTRNASRRKTRTLVLAPTRELCSQIADSFAAYGRNTPLRYAVIYGGVTQMHQVRALRHGVDAIIGTPGRLLDLMQQGHVDLSHVEILILDEADRMLDMGFIPDLRRIIARVPKKRQTLMFSATMPTEIRQLANEWLVDPVGVQVAHAASTAELIEHSVYFVEKKSKVKLLREWLEKTPNTRTLVFARTKHGADKIVKELLRSRIFAAAIHGNKSQSQRERALAQFKSSRPPVLVATDIAARGLDVAGVSHVVNFDLPAEPETYVHRIGRTGRAGATGAAVTFCSVEEVGQLRSIERLTRRRIDPAADHGEYEMAGQIAPAASESSRQRTSGRRDGRGGKNRQARSGSLPSVGRAGEGGEAGTRFHHPSPSRGGERIGSKRRRRRSLGGGRNR
jgi:ATP-dependent RNA helicase RhlE